MLAKDFVFCVHVHFYIFTTAHFHPAASISHFLTAAMKFHVFLPTKFVCLALPLLST